MTLGARVIPGIGPVPIPRSTIRRPANGWPHTRRGDGGVDGGGGGGWRVSAHHTPSRPPRSPPSLSKAVGQFPGCSCLAVSFGMKSAAGSPRPIHSVPGPLSSSRGASAPHCTQPHWRDRICLFDSCAVARGTNGGLNDTHYTGGRDRNVRRITQLTKPAGGREKGSHSVYYKTPLKVLCDADIEALV